MKTRILFMFSLFLITGSLFGQVEKLNYFKFIKDDKFEYIDSDVRNITGPSHIRKISSPLNQSFNRSVLEKINHNSKNFIYQDIGPSPSLIPVRPSPGFNPINKENKIMKNLYYPHSLYLPEYQFRDTIEK
jgi:hypothetical protein